MDNTLFDEPGKNGLAVGKKRSASCDGSKKDGKGEKLEFDVGDRSCLGGKTFTATIVNGNRRSNFCRVCLSKRASGDAPLVHALLVEVLSPREIRMRVWERGSGVTMACGTGACAAAVASHWTGRTERAVDVKLDGGTLRIRWDKASNRVFMTGPAATVFEGKFFLA